MRKSFYEMEFEVDSKVVDGKRIVNLFPSPDNRMTYQQSIGVMDEESVQLLWCKSFFGINHTTQLFQIMHDTYESKLSEVKNINDVLTVHALFCDMIIRFGTIIEDFAGICSACGRYSTEGVKIIEHFVAFGNPSQFYTDMLSPRRDEYIREIFRIPQSKEELDSIFSNLTNDEKYLIWKGILATTKLISDRIEAISDAIVRKQPINFTLFDLYNKLKHGFAPLYPYIIPVTDPISIETSDIQLSDEEIVESFLAQSMYIMHNKLPAQMSVAERMRAKDQKLGTVTTTQIDVIKETSDEILATVKLIDYLYNNLVNRYIAFAQGSKWLRLLSSDDLTDEERNALEVILNDDSRYV
jgi:hypothetical protein